MKRLILYLMTGMCVASATAQNVTYNHDAAKQNQFTVAEIGSGSLTPDLYYTPAQQLQEDRLGEEQAVVPHHGGNRRILAGGRC